MNHKLLSTLASGAFTTVGLLAVAVAASTPAYADDITIEPQTFVSNRTREEVGAELRTPYPGGNPWSDQYDMFQAPSTATREQVRHEYIANRSPVAALHAEDSGSMYMKAPSLAPESTRAMGAAR